MKVDFEEHLTRWSSMLNQSYFRNYEIGWSANSDSNTQTKKKAIFLLSKDGTASHTQQHFESNWFASFFSEPDEKKRDDASQKTMAEGHVLVWSCCVTWPEEPGGVTPAHLHVIGTLNNILDWFVEEKLERSSQWEAPKTFQFQRRSACIGRANHC